MSEIHVRREAYNVDVKVKPMKGKLSPENTDGIVRFVKEFCKNVSRRPSQRVNRILKLKDELEAFYFLCH